MDDFRFLVCGLNCKKEVDGFFLLFYFFRRKFDVGYLLFVNSFLYNLIEIVVCRIIEF